MPSSRVQRLLEAILVMAPLVTLPLMLTVRWSRFIAPNEEPKWAILIIEGLFLVTAASMMPLISARPQDKQRASPKETGLSWPSWAFFCFWLGLGLGTLYAVNGGEALNRFSFWSFAICTLLATVRSTRNDPSYHLKLQTSIALSTLLLSGLFWYGFFVDFKNPNFNPFVGFSRIGHFNFTADALMWLIPLNLWATITSRASVIRLSAAASVASGSFMLLTSGSLGGIGGLLAGGALSLTIALSVGRPPHREHDTLRLRPGRSLTIGILLLTILAAKPIIDHMPQQFRDAMFVRAEWDNPPVATSLETATHLPPLTPFWMSILPIAGARTSMWASTSGMIADNPWVGLGTGSYLFEYPAYSKRYDLFGDFETLGVKVKTNPHNVLLQIAAENGIPMMLLFLGLYSWLFIKVLREALRQPTAFWLCGVWALTAAGLDALVNHVFFNPASLFLSAVVIGIYYGSLPINPYRTKTVLPSPIRSIALPIAALVGSFWLASFPLRWLISEYYVAEALRLEAENPPPSERLTLSTWVTARTWSPKNVLPLYGLAQFHMAHGHYLVAERYLDAFLRLFPHHSAALNLMGNIETKTHRLDAAEKSFERALKLEPDATDIRENLEMLRKWRNSTPQDSGKTESP